MTIKPYFSNWYGNEFVCWLLLPTISVLKYDTLYIGFSWLCFDVGIEIRGGK